MKKSVPIILLYLGSTDMKLFGELTITVSKPFLSNSVFILIQKNRYLTLNGDTFALVIDVFCSTSPILKSKIKSSSFDKEVSLSRGCF